VRRGRELACGAGQVCARRAQELNIADGAGSAGMAQARMWSAQMRARGRHARRRAQELAAQDDGVRAVAYGSWWSATWRRMQERAARSALECKRWATGGQVARTALERMCERGSDAARPGEHGFGSRKRKSSCTACRTTMCREVTRNAREVAMRRLQADLPREQ
jgi:hypothetical protein